MKPKILPISLAVIVGAICFIVGHMSSSSSSTAQDLNASPNSSLRPGYGSSQSAFPQKPNRNSTNSRPYRNSATSPSASKADPIAHMREVNAVYDPIERTRLWLELVNSLAPDQFEDFYAAFLDTNPTDERMDDCVTLLAAWANADPAGALESKTAADDTFVRDTILASWASFDPDSAIAWAKSNHEGEGANPFMVGVIKSLAFQDPDRATALISEMPKSDERGEALDILMPTIMKRGIAETRAWVSAISDPSLREDAMISASESMASEDPHGTLAWLTANPDEATDIYYTLYAIASKDESAAMSYFNTLPAGETRSNALNGIINALAEENPQRAAALMNQNSGDLTDRTVHRFFWNTFEKDPQTAFSSIAHMKNTKDQERLYVDTLDWWMRRDQQAAIDWVNNNPVPPYVVDRLNRDLQNQSEKGD